MAEYICSLRTIQLSTFLLLDFEQMFRNLVR